MIQPRTIAAIKHLVNNTDCTITTGNNCLTIRINSDVLPDYVNNHPMMLEHSPLLREINSQGCWITIADFLYRCINDINTTPAKFAKEYTELLLQICIKAKLDPQCMSNPRQSFNTARTELLTKGNSRTMNSILDYMLTNRLSISQELCQLFTYEEAQPLLASDRCILLSQTSEFMGEAYG